jgi:DNA-directed RNA polymerase specialized sigma subunit
LQTLLKLDEKALREQLKGGKTLAQIAEAQGVSRADLKATLIAANNESLDQAKAKFVEHVDRIMDSTLQDHGRHKHHMKFDFAETAKLLGMSKEDLKSELKKGTTLADLAKQKGVEVQKVIDLLASQMITRADQALKDGKITQNEYNERKTKIKDVATKIVNGEFHSRQEQSNSK